MDLFHILQGNGGHHEPHQSSNKNSSEAMEVNETQTQHSTPPLFENPGGTTSSSQHSRGHNMLSPNSMSRVPSVEGSEAGGVQQNYLASSIPPTQGSLYHNESRLVSQSRGLSTLATGENVGHGMDNLTAQQKNIIQMPQGSTTMDPSSIASRPSSARSRLALQDAQQIPQQSPLSPRSRPHSQPPISSSNSSYPNTSRRKKPNLVASMRDPATLGQGTPSGGTRNFVGPRASPSFRSPSSVLLGPRSGPLNSLPSSSTIPQNSSATIHSSASAHISSASAFSSQFSQGFSPRSPQQAVPNSPSATLPPRRLGRSSLSPFPSSGRKKASRSITPMRDPSTLVEGLERSQTGLPARPVSGGNFNALHLLGHGSTSILDNYTSRATNGFPDARQSDSGTAPRSQFPEVRPTQPWGSQRRIEDDSHAIQPVRGVLQTTPAEHPPYPPQPEFSACDGQEMSRLRQSSGRLSHDGFTSSGTLTFQGVSGVPQSFTQDRQQGLSQLEDSQGFTSGFVSTHPSGSQVPPQMPISEGGRTYEYRSTAPSDYQGRVGVHSSEGTVLQGLPANASLVPLTGQYQSTSHSNDSPFSLQPTSSQGRGQSSDIGTTGQNSSRDIQEQRMPGAFAGPEPDADRMDLDDNLDRAMTSPNTMTTMHASAFSTTGQIGPNMGDSFNRHQDNDIPSIPDNFQNFNSHFLRPVMTAISKHCEDLSDTIRRTDERHRREFQALREKISQVANNSGAASRTPTGNSREPEAEGSTGDSDGEDDQSDPRSHHPLKSTFMNYLRLHLLYLLKLETLDNLKTIAPLTDEEVEAYKINAPNSITITADNWRYDFSRPRDNLFNKEAEYVFADSFIDELRNGGYTHPNPLPEVFWDAVYVKARFHSQLKYLCGLYRQQRNPNEAKRILELEKKARARRKQQLYEATMVYLSEENEDKCHRVLYHHAGVDIISSDESGIDDEGDPVYFTVTPGWRSEELTTLQRSIQWRRKRSRAVKHQQRGGVGSKPRIRVLGHRIDTDAPAPPGMPRNCYGVPWMETLRSGELARLKVANYDYDFTNGQFSA